ncbi:MAG: hypothetical protein ABWY05_05205 [Noviherbaspirillum sp.]
MLSSGDLAVSGAGAALSNAGIIQAGGALALGQDESRLGSLSNAAGGELLGAAVRFAGREFDNAGLVQGNAGLEVIAGAGLRNRAAARMVATDAQAALQLHAARLDNAGSLQSAGTLLARAAGDIDNRGQVQAAGALDAGAGAALRNHGPNGSMLSTGGDLALAAAALDNAGRLQAARNLGASVRGALGNSGTILNQRSEGALALQAGELDNSGVVQAAGAAQLSATAGRLRNRGKVSSDAALALAAAKGLENSGAGSRLLAAGALQITGAAGFDVANEGRIQSGAALSVGSASGRAARLANSAGAVLLGDGLAIHAGGVANSGSLGAQKNAQITRIPPMPACPAAWRRKAAPAPTPRAAPACSFGTRPRRSRPHPAARR